METAESKHRRMHSKSSRPRSSTKGPLDAPDDLQGIEGTTSPSGLRVPSPLNQGDFSGETFNALDPLFLDDLPETMGKDLSFLLRKDIYHPLSQISIPPALRSEFLNPVIDEPLSSLLSKLEKLLAEGHFLLAAHLCGTILTSIISPTSCRLIFALFYTRLACLELSGNVVFAAQESKALEDLSSAFYYITPELEASDSKSNSSHVSSPRHIAPWPLRVLAVRLQCIGFGDSRRGIGGLYEIGMEARREILRPDIKEAEMDIWKERLADLGIRSVNMLIEMGDLDTARRSLDNLKGSNNVVHNMRRALLFLKIGDLDAAKQITDEFSDPGAAMLKPLLKMTEGRYGDAVVEWRALLESGPKRSDEVIVSQNLAVCLLYTGQLNEARVLLESLISANHSFASLTFNLSTIYELCSDKSTGLKSQLSDAVARQPVSGDMNLDRPNADFKL
ncbi:hypothetical protein MPDQ_003203 [Monascus purpureus]|uniref:Trafficking protein particle complex subunit 12 n=1 Tax=Monascus purpureus TaxID=5098 RepID=A0A507QLR6_MONPU|nr:hypothetical protein MPDQ_003203 [Monascus purpureus]